MTIIRRKHLSRYAAFPNAIWEDERIGVDEKGVLGYLLSRPPNWNVHLSQVARAMRVGKDRMQRIFRTLIAAGYVARETIRNENGVIVALEYVIRDEPEFVQEGDGLTVDTDEDSDVFQPQPENPAPGRPAPGKAAGYKEKKILNTDYTKHSSLAESSTAARARPSPNTPHLRPEELQARIASRLGEGDAALGYEMLCKLSDSEMDQITAQQRLGKLSEEGLARVRLKLLTGRDA